MTALLLATGILKAATTVLAAIGWMGSLHDFLRWDRDQKRSLSREELRIASAFWIIAAVVMLAGIWTGWPA